MNTQTETLISILFPYLTLIMLFLLAVWKSREPYFRYLVAVGIFFNVMIGAWGFVPWFFMETSDVFQEEYGRILGAFFSQGYFILFHIAVLTGYGILSWIRLGSIK